MGICPASPLPRGRGLRRPEEREKSTIKPDSAPATPLSPTRLPRLHVAVRTSDTGTQGAAPALPGPRAPGPLPPRSPRSPFGSGRGAPHAPGQLRSGPGASAESGSGRGRPGRRAGAALRCQARQMAEAQGPGWRRGRAGAGPRSAPLFAWQAEGGAGTDLLLVAAAPGGGRAGNAAGCPRCAAGLRRGGRAAPPARAEEKLPPCGAGRAAPALPHLRVGPGSRAGSERGGGGAPLREAGPGAVPQEPQEPQRCPAGAPRAAAPPRGEAAGPSSG